jgi:hypothetical protein
MNPTDKCRQKRIHGKVLSESRADRLTGAHKEQQTRRNENVHVLKVLHIVAQKVFRQMRILGNDSAENESSESRIFSGDLNQWLNEGL